MSNVNLDMYMYIRGYVMINILYKKNFYAQKKLFLFLI